MCSFNASVNICVNLNFRPKNKILYQLSQAGLFPSKFLSQYESIYLDSRTFAKHSKLLIAKAH